MCSTVVEELRPGMVPAWRLSDDALDAALADVEATEARLVAWRAELLREAELRGLKDRSTTSRSTGRAGA